jgi:hypothetical protein
MGETEMNAQELLKRIDACQATGKTISAESSSSDSAKGFYGEIRAIAEEIYGAGSHLSGKLDELGGCSPEAVKEGLEVLEELRRVVNYAGYSVS